MESQKPDKERARDSESLLLGIRRNKNTIYIREIFCIEMIYLLAVSYILCKESLRMKNNNFKKE